MGNPLIDLLAAAVALVALVCMVGLLGSGSLYGRIGAGGTSLPEDRDPEDPAAASRQRDLEIRQMLQARSERRQRQGLAPLDIDAEAARLRDGTAAVGGDRGHESDDRRHDPELLEELRQLAVARNERRLRNGQPPLDVQAEVRRRLAELDG